MRLRALLLALVVVCALIAFIAFLVLVRRGLFYYADRANQQQQTPVVVYVPSPIHIPAPTPEPTPQPIAPPTPLPVYKVIRTGGMTWKVIIPRGDWRETNIPVITGDTIAVSSNDHYGRFLVQVDGHPFFGTSTGGVPWVRIRLCELAIAGCSLAFGPEFGTTLQVKAADDAGINPVELDITVSGSGCGLNSPYSPVTPQHQESHRSAISWRNSQLNNY
jgi:hypothetical protein